MTAPRSDDEIRADIEKLAAKYLFAAPPERADAAWRLARDVAPLLDRALAAEALNAQFSKDAAHLSAKLESAVAEVARLRRVSALPADADETGAPDGPHYLRAGEVCPGCERCSAAALPTDKPRCDECARFYSGEPTWKHDLELGCEDTCPCRHDHRPGPVLVVPEPQQEATE